MAENIRVEQRPKPELQISYEKQREIEKVGAMLCQLTGEWLPIPTVDNAEMPSVLIVDRQLAYSFGIGPHGEVPEDIDDSQLDELFVGAIDPSLN